LDDQEYKRLCAQPDVMRRADIRATAVRLHADQPQLASILEELLQHAPVPKPADFSGGEEADFFYLDLPAFIVEEIAEALADVERAVALANEGTPELSFVAGLHDRWRAAESSRTS
jgi:hypothetical protein